LSEDEWRVLKRGEVISFGVTAVAMLSSIIFFPGYYWLFILLTVVDGFSTGLQSARILTADRIFFALLVLVLGAFAFGLDILAMILETVLVIVLLDLLFLIRRMWTPSRSDFYTIILQRLRSYFYTLFPAAFFAAGLIYLSAVTIGETVGPSNAILELGIASAVVFLIILMATDSARIPDDFSEK
jgi:hypothetical protein